MNRLEQRIWEEAKPHLPWTEGSPLMDFARELLCLLEDQDKGNLDRPVLPELTIPTEPQYSERDRMIIDIASKLAVVESTINTYGLDDQGINWSLVSAVQFMRHFDQMKAEGKL